MEWVGGCFLTPLPSRHHYLVNLIDMSSPVAFLFLFKEDALTYNVVESMEQVGGLAA